MKTRIRFAALLLGLALCATGCSSIGLRDRTVVLPTPEPALTLEDDAAAEAFTVQNIDQFAFQTDCLSPGGTRTPHRNRRRRPEPPYVGRRQPWPTRPAACRKPVRFSRPL